MPTAQPIVGIVIPRRLAPFGSPWKNPFAQWIAYGRVLGEPFAQWIDPLVQRVAYGLVLTSPFVHLVGK